MKPIFKLNDFQVKNNALAGSHDPSMMYDEKTKKYYSYSTDINGEMIGVDDKIGIPVRSSENLVDFKYEGTVLSQKAIDEAQNNGKYEKTFNFWAPFVEYVDNEYRLYYSATRAFGSSESKIWLAVSDNPLGPFENRGVVIDTWGTDDTYPNGIDPHIIRTENRCFLVYGSFFGGIYLKELNTENGMPLDNNPKNLGRCIARKAENPRIDGPEGAAVIYANNYFYLFLSYGWLGENYDIRVGRSETVDGDYLDMNGKNLVEQSMGLKIANSYCFSAENPDTGNDNSNWKWAGFMGNGHGVPFFDPVRKQYFFVHHVRDGAEIYKRKDTHEDRPYYWQHYMMIRPMFFVNGWPVLSPEPFADEPFKDISLEKALKDCLSSTTQKWEFILLDDQNNHRKCSFVRNINVDDILLKQGKIHLCWDFENQKQTLIVTGINEFGVAYWGKLLYNSIIDFSKILL